ncbi:protein SABRE-like isoform X2 [Aristolochia californica]|uniref:protein SABRE-like isoform X2 n=1 Tax=Aristolochia californica TaxID=171875 RepID=UPI0035D784F2
MAPSPVKFLFTLLLTCIFGWIIFIFTARLLAWVLSRIMGASVGFRVAGCNCLRDVNVKFKKGAVESVSVGEIKLSLRKSLVKLGFSFISRDPKLQLLICELEVVIRQPEPRVRKDRPQRPAKPHTSGSRGKWMLVANMARFLSVHITDLVIKVPKATMEVKDLKVDISKDGEPVPALFVKLKLVPVLCHMAESRFNCEQSSTFSHEGYTSGQTYLSNVEKNLVPFICEELSLSSEFGHDREIGVVIKNVDITSGEVTVNLHEDLFHKNKKIDTAAGTALVAPPAKKTSKKQNYLESVKKNIVRFPEKVSFILPKLDVRFLHRGQGLFLDNNVMGIQFKSSKSQLLEESGEITSHFDVQMDFSEIHLVREGGSAVLEILKLAVVSSLDIPLQLTSPIRAEIDIKLGGTQCNIIMSRLKPWMHLHMSKKKRMVLHENHANHDRPDNTERADVTDRKAIMWTCTLSAPEMTIVLYNLNGLPLYHGCSQSSHLFANNIASRGIQVHMELGELHLQMADDNQECLRESLFGVETNSGSLVHVARVSLDWGHKEMDSPEGKSDPNRWKLVFFVDVTGMSVYLSFQRVESLLSTMVSFKPLLKSLSPGKRTTSNTGGGHPGKSSKGTCILRFNLERCSVIFYGDVGVENAVILDPKKVNYGSQGGQIVIGLSADGTPRSANIASTTSDGPHSRRYSTSLDIFHFSISMNRDKHSTQMDLERARCIYQEYSQDCEPNDKVTLFDMQNARFVRRSGGHNEIAVCSLFSATDIAVRWEPDVHISLYELVIRLKAFVHSQRLQSGPSDEMKEDLEQDREGPIEPVRPDKQHKKKESVFAIDIEMLRVSAELADGVEMMLQVQSIFSENARIGVLLEGLILSFNEARVFRSSRMQISRIPNVSASNFSSEVKVPAVTTWDWVIRGLDVHIFMPYRLQLRAIEDAVEDTLRGLKLITSAKSDLIYPTKKESTEKSKPKFSKLGCVKFNLRKLTADIEEEPLQGWLDEHYHLLKNEICESEVRLKFLDEVISEGTGAGSELNETSCERKNNYNGCEIDVNDRSAIQNLRDEIYKQAFQSYYKACQRLVPSEGSGACKAGFQAGFKLSSTRTSLLSICATELDLTLVKIEGGDDGMIEFIRKHDPVAATNDIPFSRLLGRNIGLTTGSLVVQIRDYMFPIFSATVGKCEGCVVLAQQATFFQPQIQQDVFIGKWRRVRVLRSASGTTPALKTYTDLPISFQKAEVSFGVGYEPVLADISYAFTVALRRANLGSRNGPDALTTLNQPKKEKSLPWWDDMRYYIHGKIGLSFNETTWYLLATTNPYETLDKVQLVSGYMDIQQSDGCVTLSAKDFKVFVSSLESLINSCSLKIPVVASVPFADTPAFCVEVSMNWECDSGNPLDHYLHSVPKEGKPREKVLDPFRSTSLSLRFNFSLRPSLPPCEKEDSAISVTNGPPIHGKGDKSEPVSVGTPTLSFGAHDLAWVFRWWNLYYNPPHKLRSFSRWPRFGVPRIPRSGNLSLDKVMTELFLRFDSMPACLKHMPLRKDDPAGGLTFRTTKLKYEVCYSRGRQKYTFDCRRDPLDLVYQGLDLHMLKAHLNKENKTCVVLDVQATKRTSQALSTDKVNTEKCSYIAGHDDGFLLSSDYFTIRKQTPKADPTKLLAWQEAGRKNLEMTYVRSEFENGSESDHTRSDPSDDDGFNVVIADNCQRVFVYGLKLLWTLKNRDAVWAWVGGISKAFEPPKSSPSRQYAQRKLLEEQQILGGTKMPHEDNSKPSLSANQGSSLSLPLHVDTVGSHASPFASLKAESSSGLVEKHGKIDNSEEEGTRHFMVNVIQPQFNLHSEEANGRFLLAAASGRVLARSFHSVLHVGYEMIEQALGTGSIRIPETEPEMTWKRVELSVMLEHVQAHVAPTDVDPGAGLQWLPKILRSSPKVKRTGALLERVFMPCTMYFRYTRHKGGTAELKVKPLKELTFNSPNITATMTSRQFQVMVDILSNLLFARLPKRRKSSLSYASDDDDEDVGEEADEVVPDGVEEVELAKINLEQAERERRLLLDDIRTLSVLKDFSVDPSLFPERSGDLWMISGGIITLVQGLKKELGNKQKSRKAASALLRTALQKAAQLRLMEKEKNKSPSCAMRISLRIDKVVWGMLADGKPFAEAEINNMIYDFDRDYKDIGVAQFTTKSFVVRNCLPNAKCDMLLSAWNPPPEWGKNVMLRVDAKQGAPKEGNSPLELFQVEIYPLKIHLTETMYRMMWGYFFPEEEQDSQRRQELWKVSTTAGLRAGLRRVRKIAAMAEPSALSSRSKECEVQSNLTGSAVSTSTAGANQSAGHVDTSQGAKLRLLYSTLFQLLLTAGSKVA